MEGGGAQMVRVRRQAIAEGRSECGLHVLRAIGSAGHEIWNVVADPANPVLLSRIGEGLKDTHKNFWEFNTGVAFTCLAPPEWRNLPHDHDL